MTAVMTQVPVPTATYISVFSLSLAEYGYGGISANNLLEKVKNTIHSRLFAENE